MSDPSNPLDEPPSEGATTDTTDTDRGRRRRMGAIAGIGMGVGAVLALLAGAAGATGRAGAAIFLLLAAGSCALAATYGVITAVIDDLRETRVSRSRIGWVVALFFAAAALMAMTAGVGG